MRSADSDHETVPGRFRQTHPRILQVITHLALGGAERVALNLIRGLHGHFDFAVFAVLGVEESEFGHSMLRELEELQVTLNMGTAWPIKYGGLLPAATRLASAIRRYQPNLVHVHTEIPEAAYSVAVTLRPGLRRIPTVRTVHNAIYWGHWRPLGQWCDRTMHGSHVACVGTDAQRAFRALRTRSGAETPAHGPEIIHNGVPVPATAYPLDRPRKGTFRMLFAGRLEDQKGADLLPSIVQAVRPPAGLRCDLTIYGSGTYESILRGLASTPPDGWVIRVEPPVPDLARRMLQFDLLLMPSRFEGLALVAIEAALLGLPVIATNAPGLHEVFPDTHPWLASPGDSKSFTNLLQVALDEPETLVSATERAREHAKRLFALHTMCDGYAALYRRALGS